MKDMLLSKALDLVLPLIVGLVVPHIVDLLKRASAWLDTAPAQVKQVMAFVIAGGATALAQALGISVPTELAAWDAAFVQTALAGLLGIAMKQNKQLKKLKANAAAIPPVATPSEPIAPDSPFHIPPQGEP